MFATRESQGAIWGQSGIRDHHGQFSGHCGASDFSTSGGLRNTGAFVCDQFYMVRGAAPVVRFCGSLGRVSVFAKQCKATEGMVEHLER